MKRPQHGDDPSSDGAGEGAAAASDAAAVAAVADAAAVAAAAPPEAAGVGHAVEVLRWSAPDAATLPATAAARD